MKLADQPLTGPDGFEYAVHGAAEPNESQDGIRTTVFINPTTFAAEVEKDDVTIDSMLVYIRPERSSQVLALSVGEFFALGQVIEAMKGSVIDVFSRTNTPGTEGPRPAPEEPTVQPEQHPGVPGVRPDGDA